MDDRAASGDQQDTKDAIAAFATVLQSEPGADPHEDPRRHAPVRHSSGKRRPAQGSGASPTNSAPPAASRKRSSDLDEDRSLTSFPSLSPESSPHVSRNKQKASLIGKITTNRGNDVADPDATPRGPPKPSLVESLMARSSPSARGRDSLFADSPATTAQDVPGALHHASDDHIRRVVARRGVVALVRQLAGDLAQREAEMTTLRLRAEARERELKRMLREVEISNLDIEKRLHSLEERERGAGNGSRSHRNSLGSVGDLVDEALGDTLSSTDDEEYLTRTTTIDAQATIRASAVASAEVESLSSSVDSGKKQGWMNYFLGSSTAVKKQRTGSPAAQDGGFRTASAAGARRGIDENTFQPPSEDSGARDTSMTRIASNRSNLAARRASKNSWTLKLFAGGSQKDGDSQTNRGRSSTSASDGTKSLRDASRDSRHAVAGAATRTTHGKRQSLQSIAVGLPVKGDPRSSMNAPLASPNSFDTSENLGPVEMDAILPHGLRPPTLSPMELGTADSDILTDRFGFIYDQRRRKKEAEAMARSAALDPKRHTESLGNPLDLTGLPDPASSARSSTPASFNEQDEAGEGEAASSDGRRWQDYLKISAAATELLSQTPAPSAIVAENAGAEDRQRLKRIPTLSGDVGGPGLSPTVSASNVTASKAELAKPVLSSPASPALPRAPVQEVEPVKLLLSRLGELHDKLQREKTIRWNEFMRKVRAERRREGENPTGSETRGKTDLPEAHIADGEIIGIASLGHKGKIGRAKYREFRALVLAGIPVVHRAKVWSECSGANTLRIPGYYQELVQGQSDADPTVLAQIEVDINRTLTDNVFFRSGPGVGKLNEVLLAYARRNPEVGYCQGMNLITASLLLIMPTSEDAFWILASLVEGILPMHYYDHSLLASRADQQVLRSYVTELLPRLASHLAELGVELEAVTFQWFLSLFTACLSAEALYRVWDVLLCLNQDLANGGSTFLFQIALALLKLNETALTACETPGEIYAYLGGEITNHAISIDGLIRASEGLKTLVRRDEVEQRRKKWVAIEEETIRERERIRNGGNSGNSRTVGSRRAGAGAGTGAGSLGENNSQSDNNDNDDNDNDNDSQNKSSSDRLNARKPVPAQA